MFECDIHGHIGEETFEAFKMLITDDNCTIKVFVDPGFLRFQKLSIMPLGLWPPNTFLN